MVESYNLKEKFDGNLTKLADHIENAIYTDKVRVIHKIIKEDKIYFVLEDVSEKSGKMNEKNKCRLAFDFTGAGLVGIYITVEFEHVYAFSVDFDYFYIEPDKNKWNKHARLHAFKGIR